MRVKSAFLAALLGLGCGGMDLAADDLTPLNAQLEAAVKNDAKNASAFFTDKAYLFFEKDRIWNGRSGIAEAFERMFAGREFVRIETKHRVKGLEGAYYYELGLYVLKGRTYAYLCKWVPADGSWKKEFEAVSEKNNTIDDTSGIRKTQQKSRETSKARDNRKTVTALYWETGHYYTNGRLHTGLAAITEAWYPNLQFQESTELAHIQAKDDLIFQIGKYNVGGSIGLYILVWVRKKNVWKVYLDSNV